MTILNSFHNNDHDHGISYNNIFLAYKQSLSQFMTIIINNRAFPQKKIHKIYQHLMIVDDNYASSNLWCS
ncbi:hypothetical protein DERP_006896 [Dermatophagoides pteronyssinus]|uniref:Uncharacterized protein n=1 Tax=Dermatophagoides pteronyssinus TaxID=6956 RepID=A0ABQ8ISA8_DERPT|nr:hypothetical protein DERP_006896 [Dermatophagoides pteronyssinus]